MTGLFDSLRGLLASTLDIARVRLDLFGSELQAEKLRLFDAAWQAALALLLFGLALVLLLGFVVLLFWDGYRLPAVGVLALLFALAGAWLLGRARRQLHSDEGGPFTLTLGEFKRDLAALRPEATTLPAANDAPAPPVP